MTDSGKDHLKQLDELLATSNQAWLFGAGISLDAGLPLMYALTERILSRAGAEEDKNIEKVLKAVKTLLPQQCHIEHLLSHICDYIAIAERSLDKIVTFSDITMSSEKLRAIHSKVLDLIADTIRWGYVAATKDNAEKVGSRGKCIVCVKKHQNFMEALFNRTQAGIENRRSPVKFFTTNYDTLLEDSLSLACFPYWDGFSGGAVAYKSHHYGDSDPDSNYRAHVIKLHGSIDWHLSDDDKVWRVRDGDKYPSTSNRVLIYPQATKYLATQRDPFSGQFDLFRRFLSSQNENILAVCGYSCGDEHINQEMEIALQRAASKTTLIIFSQSLNPVLSRWRNSKWANRLYCVTEDGLFVGNEGPFGPTRKLNWWRFDGVTELLDKGAEAYVK